MTRADLVAKMAGSAGWPKTSTDRAFRAMLEAIRNSLKHGDPVTLVGFGTFAVGKVKPRPGRNPRTGKPVVIGGRTPRFKPSKELKLAVR
jgi:DNA-binding protein HU-beta